MIKTIIVDDEIEIVEGLQNMIPWGEYNCEIVGTATNGKFALELIKTQPVELLITDITMPAMNGIELIREVKELKKDIRTILLTCHSSFDYAKEAIRLEVDEYLVKHLLSKELLISTIKKIDSKINEDKVRENKIYLANNLISQNKVILYEKFFNDIMNNKFINREDMKAKANQYNILMPDKYYRTIGIFIEDYDISLGQGSIQDGELLKFTLLNILEELLLDVRMHQYVWADNRGSIYFIHWGKMERKIIEDDLMEKLNCFLESTHFLKIPISIYITNKYYDIFDLKNSIMETKGMQERSFYESSKIVLGQNIRYEEMVKSSDYQPLSSNFLKNFKATNKITSIHALDYLLHTIKTNRYSPGLAKRILDDIIMEIRVEYRKQGIELDVKKLEPDTFLGYKNVLYRLTNNFLEKQEALLIAPHREEIIRVLSYIENHIDDRITCEEMAMYVNMSRSYFSRLFKDELGTSFSDYVLSRKIEYAKEVLLNTNSTIQEVSERVGFDTVSNFYRMFKKIIGKTPKQIRERA